MTGLDEIDTLQCLKAGGCKQLDASTLRRCRSLLDVDLRGSDVTNAVLDALADVSTLETFKLTLCGKIRDVSALARSVSLRQLDLQCSAVCDAGIAELERIPSAVVVCFFKRPTGCQRLRPSASDSSSVAASPSSSLVHGPHRHCHRYRRRSPSPSPSPSHHRKLRHSRTAVRVRSSRSETISSFPQRRSSASVVFSKG
jgi:hypothetical protein